MRYQANDIVLIKKHHSHTREYREFLEKHEYKLTVVSRTSLASGTNIYVMKELKNNPFFGNCTVLQKDINCLSEDNFVEPINNRFEILDL